VAVQCLCVINRCVRHYDVPVGCLVELFRLLMPSQRFTFDCDDGGDGDDCA